MHLEQYMPMEKKEGSFPAQGSPVKYGDIIRQLPESVQLLSKVALTHCVAHQFGNMPTNVRN